MKLLEIGPGNEPQDGYETLDCFEHFHPTYLVDIVKDLHWPIPDNTFDKVIAIHVLEHVELARVKNVFQNVLRILKPGGRFQVHVPNGPVIIDAYTKFPHRRDVIQTCIYGAEAAEETKYHVAHKVLYDLHLLTKQFCDNGFKEVVEVSKEVFDRHDPYWEWMDDTRPFSLKVAGFK